MNCLRNAGLIRFGVLAAVLILTTESIASPWAEIGNAGDLPGTAQNTVGVGALSQVTGLLSLPDDKDIFRIFVPAGGGFSAEVVATTPSDDTKLYLLRSDGRGILGDDDSGPCDFCSRLPLGHSALSGLPEGQYFLAISDFDFIPISAGGPIFPAGNLAGPTGPGGASPMTGWSQDGHEIAYTYDIRLTGAQFSNVPEPATVSLIAFAIFSIFGTMRSGCRHRE